MLRSLLHREHEMSTLFQPASTAGISSRMTVMQPF